MIGAALVAALRAATWAFWVATLRSWNAAALTFLFSSRRSTTSRYDQPNSCEMRCGTQGVSGRSKRSSVRDPEQKEARRSP